MGKIRETVLEIAGREVVISNPGKTFFPEVGYTKLAAGKLVPTGSSSSRGWAPVAVAAMAEASVAIPVSAETVMLALAPIFTVATAKTPVPLEPGMFTMPSLLSVAT